MSSSEIAQFVEHNASRVTLRIAENLLRQLPLLKVEFAQLDDPALPHLFNQLKFLSDVVEDVLEGKEKDIPYYAIAAACFAIIYAHKAEDIIPDYVQGFGHLDDSAVVRYVLIRYEPFFRSYALKRNLRWETITTAA